MTFRDLNLSAELLKAVEEAGYSDPTPIQEQAIPAALSGRDVLGIAQTGTGKTASFTLPLIDLLAQGRAKARMPRCVILTPTRELAAQVSQSFEKYGKNHKLTMALLIGGVSFEDQERLLDRGVDVLIATPGRLLDHFERGRVLLSGVQIMVVDEADRMLDMGFIPDIERIFKLTPFTRQTLFFSATMPPEIDRITSTFLQNPVRIAVAPPSTVVDTITQWRVMTPKDFAAKRDVLRKLLLAENVTTGIIFCNRKRDVDIVWKSLQKHGFAAGAIHGDLEQSVRMATLDQFKDGTCQYLVASDVAARGLDIPDVSHVINFDVPTHAEDYVHRIGRTGRAGKQGCAYTLSSKAETKYVEAIEQETGLKLEEKVFDFSSSSDDTNDRDNTGRDNKDRRRSSGRGSRQENKSHQSGNKTHQSGKSAGQDNGRDQRPDKPSKKSDPQEPVIGLGEHTPAFLLKPAPISATRSKKVA